MTGDVFIPTLSHATERDVDLLLVEELYANRDFVLWFMAEVGQTGEIASWDVKHSKRRTRSRREIDIFIEISLTDKSRCAMLIENKLDASEQPDQAESYREELDALSGGYRQAAMIIVSPANYIAQNNGFASKFDATISYEAIRDWFAETEAESGDELVLRHRLRAELFEQAINKHRRGYTAIPDKVIGDFNAKYVALLAKVAAEITPGNNMLRLENPHDSTSMIFDQNKCFSALPKDIRPSRFAHELGRGLKRRANYVAVTFAGWGAALPAIRSQLEADTVEIGATFTAKPPTKIRPNPGLVMSFPTEPVDNQGNFSDQIDILEDGMTEASVLQQWLWANQGKLENWRALVAQVKDQC